MTGGLMERGEIMNLINEMVNSRYVRSDICKLKHKEVDDLRSELATQRKMLWGILILQLSLVGAALLSKVM